MNDTGLWTAVVPAALIAGFFLAAVALAQWRDRDGSG